MPKVLSSNLRLDKIFSHVFVLNQVDLILSVIVRMKDFHRVQITGIELKFKGFYEFKRFSYHTQFQKE